MAQKSVSVSRIVRACEPRSAAAQRDGAPLPRFKPGFALRRHGPPPPDALAVGCLVSGQESANAPIASGHPGDDHVLDDERRDRAAVMLRFVRHHHFPQEPAGDAVQGDQVGVIGRHENLVTQEGHAAVRAQGGVGDDSRSARTGILPDEMAATRVEREHLARPGRIHDAVGDEGNRLQSEVPHVLVIVRRIGQELRPQWDRKTPAQGQFVHVAGGRSE